jgi:NADH:ubiquinone reductase (H+-translocating)
MWSIGPEITRSVLRRGVSLGRAVRAVSMPWLLLSARIWLGQVVFVHRIMMMVAEGGGHAAPPALETTVEGVVPLLLAAGLVTRPLAAAVLVETVLRADAPFDAAASAPKIALLTWLIVLGPGALSLDRVLRRGFTRIPFWPARAASWLYGWVDQAIGPLLKLAIRVAFAASLAAMPFPNFPLGNPTLPALPTVAGAAVALMLTFGVASRFAALVLALSVPVAGIAMSMDDRFGTLLLLLMLAASGAGLLSIDHLLARWACRERARDMMDDDSLPRVVVVGGGFGGTAAVRTLRDAPCRVTLIDRRNHHLFQPLLYQVATAALSPAEIAIPIRSLFRGQRNIRVHLGEVTGIDLAARDVLLGATRLRFDHLVIATGARHSYLGRDDWAPFAPGLKSVEDATSVRSRLLRAFEEAENAADAAEREAWLTFVIVGGGPTGIELAGAIAELARHGLEHEYRSIDPATAQVILVHSGPRVLPAFPSALSAAAERSLRALGVDVRLNSRVRGVDESGVVVGDHQIGARTVLWAAGVAASPAAQWLGIEADASGRVAVAEDLSVPGLSCVYAIGDTAASLAWRGNPVPGLAPAAKQQGRYVARAIRAALMQCPAPPPFRYRHFGSLATIGRQAAVAELGPLRLWGAPAWWFWGAAHIAFLVGGRNRMTVVLDWLWAYLTYRHGSRLITISAPTTLPPSAY